MRDRTKSSAIAEGPRDASCQLKSCQLPRNSAETNVLIRPTRVQNLKSLAIAVAEILHEVLNSKTGYLTETTPLSGKIFFGRVGRAMVNQCTKHEGPWLKVK